MTVAARPDLRHLSLLEHQVVEVSAEGSETALSAAEAELLLELERRRPGFCERGYRSLRLAQYAGVVNLGGRVLEVLPKVGADADQPTARAVLLRLLRRSGAFADTPVGPAGQHLTRSPLLEMFISAFLDATATVIRGGLLRQYREREEDLGVVRGRIAFSRQLGVQFNRSDVVACVYDDLTADNLWNRAIKAGLRACRPWIVSAELLGRWTELNSAFTEVKDRSFSAEQLDRLVYDRHAARYRPALRWVRWILSLLSPALRAGFERAPAFLFDLNALFEKVATLALADRLRKSHPALEVGRRHSPRHLARVGGPGGGRAFSLQPDITITHDGVPVMIADAKWKRVRSEPGGLARPARNDMYQMHAYRTGFGVNWLALVYPGPQEAKNARFILGGREGHAVVATLTVDVTRDDLPVHGLEAVLAGDKGERLDAHPGATTCDA